MGGRWASSRGPGSRPEGSRRRRQVPLETEAGSGDGEAAWPKDLIPIRRAMIKLVGLGATFSRQQRVQRTRVWCFRGRFPMHSTAWSNRHLHVFDRKFR